MPLEPELAPSPIPACGGRLPSVRVHDTFGSIWDIAIKGKPAIHGLNNPLLGSDPVKVNIEDILQSEPATCHMPWYLHDAAFGGAVVQQAALEQLAMGGCRCVLTAGFRAQPRIIPSSQAGQPTAHSP